MAFVDLTRLTRRLNLVLPLQSILLMKKLKKDYPERLDPGDSEPEWGSPGSIEQQLDMCERTGPRGDDILHNHGVSVDESDGCVDMPIDETLDRYTVDMAEENREGDEMSGDDHSSGLQGGESEIKAQPHIDTGIPGDRFEREEYVIRHSKKF